MNDRILPVTRVVSALLVPLLWLAAFLLFFYPSSTGERFAWLVRPRMTAMYMGAGYLGVSWLFTRAVFGRRWHRIQAGFLPMTVSAWFMMLATFFHWDRFAHGRPGFTLWLIAYVITPWLLPVLWFSNTKADPGMPEENDAVLPPWLGSALKGIALVLLVFAVLGFFIPGFVMRAWRWSLTPLTARVMCGWVALLGLGAFTLSNETRWSGWMVPLESVAIWHGLALAAALVNHSNFKGGLVNWYTLVIGMTLIGIVIFYLWMERRRRKRNYPFPKRD